MAGSVLTATLCRAPGNALDIDLLTALDQAVVRAGAEASVRALVIESEVEGYFSSGLDLQELLRLPQERRKEPFERLLHLYRGLLNCPKPVVAAMSGSAILGGWIIAMACDFRILAVGSKVALSEIRAGLTPTGALISRLSALSSSPRAVKEMVLRGKSLGAEEALACSLVDEVLPAQDIRAAAQALARKLAKSPPKSYAAIKRTLNEGAASPSLHAAALQEFTDIFAGAEAQEGVAALAAKRRPRWEDA